MLSRTDGGDALGGRLRRICHVRNGEDAVSRPFRRSIQCTIRNNCSTVGSTDIHYSKVEERKVKKTVRHSFAFI